MAKLTFCGISPAFLISLEKVQLRRDDADKIAVLVEERTAELPGWTGAEIWKNRLSSPIPASAVTMPVVKLPLVAKNLAQGIAERLHVLSLPCAETERAHTRRLGVHLQKRQIVGRVFGDEAGSLEISLTHANANPRAILDDVGVGDEVALIRHETAGA